MKPLTELVPMMSTGDGLSFATINATIIAIFFAAAFAYALLMYEKALDLEASAISQARHVLKYEWAAVYTGEGVAWNLAYDGTQARDREAMCYRLRRLIDSELATPEEIGVDPDDLVAVGGEILAVMCRIRQSYPFPPTASGSALVLDDQRSVARWASAMKDLGEGVFRVLYIGEEYMGVFLDALAVQLRERMGEKPTSQKGAIAFERASAEMNPRALAARFSRDIQAAHELASSVIETLDQKAIYEARVRPRRLLPLVGVAAVPFATGLLIPMFYPKVSSVVAGWIPAIAYAFGVAWFAVWLLKRGKSSASK